MPILSSDSFIRTNVASGWGTATDGETWSAVRGTPTAWSVASNEGLFTAQGGGNFTIARLGTQASGPQEPLIRLQPGSTTSDIGVVARYVDINNFYYAVLASGVVAIGKCSGGSFSTIASTAFTYSTSNFYWVRFNLISSNLRMKAWQDGFSEPGWIITTTDSAIASGGWGVGSDASVSTSYDSFVVTDASTTTISIACDGYGGVFI